MSKEQLNYLKKIKKNNFLVKFMQLMLVVSLLISWELLTKYELLNSFIWSSPSRIINTIIGLVTTNNFFNHIGITLFEVLISFSLGIILAFFIALLLYQFKFLARVLDPFLTMLNSLPKVALGPLIIIIVGANMKSIILMALLINMIVSIISIYNGFINTDEYKLKLLKSLGATKMEILKNLVIPESYQTIVTSLKLNLSLTLIGVIMGEFLVSKEGIGYLIVYGKQVFNLDYVMTGIILLAIISYIIYKFITVLERKLLKHL